MSGDTLVSVKKIEAISHTIFQRRSTVSGDVSTMDLPLLNSHNLDYANVFTVNIYYL